MQEWPNNADDDCLSRRDCHSEEAVFFLRAICQSVPVSSQLLQSVALTKTLAHEKSKYASVIHQKICTKLKGNDPALKCTSDHLDKGFRIIALQIQTDLELNRLYVKDTGMQCLSNDILYMTIALNEQDFHQPVLPTTFTYYCWCSIHIRMTLGIKADVAQSLSLTEMILIRHELLYSGENETMLLLHFAQNKLET